MVKYLKKDIQTASKTLRKSIKDNKGLPSTLNIKDSNGKTRKLSKKEYMGLYEQSNVFAVKHDRLPNYVELRSTANNPLVLDYQNTGYNCCPTSVSMASGFLFDWRSESECVKKLGTIQGSGTDPTKLVNNISKLGMKASAIKRNSTAVKNSLRLGKPVVAHIQTRPASCLGYTGDYGHYVLIYDITDTKYKIADPTKGLKSCAFKILDKATNGRDIKYYSISPL